MTTFKNTNERFGQVGTFEAESIDAIMYEMDGVLLDWAREQVQDGETLDAAHERIRAEFRAGLVEVEPEGVKVGPGWAMQLRNTNELFGEIKATTFSIGENLCAWLHGAEPDGRFVRLSANGLGWSDGCRESDVAAQTIDEAIEIAQSLIDERDDEAREDRDE